MTEAKLSKRIHVAVGVIVDARGHVLVARRADTQHLGGLWEFPGGKLEAGESVQQALYRELQEELAIEVKHSRPLCQIEHNYPEKSVLLDVWIVDSFTGEPTGVEQQPLRWLPPGELDPVQFPQANRLIIRRLQLTDNLAIVNLPALSTGALQVPNGTLLRLRCQFKRKYNEYLADVQATLSTHANTLPGVIVDMSAAHIADNGLVRQELIDLPGVKGLHAHRGLLQEIAVRPVPDHLLFGVSCHNREELARAQSLDADYVLLSPVKPTESHPDAVTLGWDLFESLTAACSVPVYALGGMSAADLAPAIDRGARGIAGIRLFNYGMTR